MNSLSFNYKKRCDHSGTIKWVIIAFFLIAGIFSFFGLDDTFQTGKDFFFLTEQTKLKYYVHLYTAMSGLVWNLGYILVFFLPKSWIKDMLILAISGGALMGSMNAHQMGLLDPLQYLETSKYKAEQMQAKNSLQTSS